MISPKIQRDGEWRKRGRLVMQSLEGGGGGRGKGGDGEILQWEKARKDTKKQQPKT